MLLWQNADQLMLQLQESIKLKKSGLTQKLKFSGALHSPHSMVKFIIKFFIFHKEWIQVNFPVLQLEPQEINNVQSDFSDQLNEQEYISEYSRLCCYQLNHRFFYINNLVIIFRSLKLYYVQYQKLVKICSILCVHLLIGGIAAQMHNVSNLIA